MVGWLDIYKRGKARSAIKVAWGQIRQKGDSTDRKFAAKNLFSLPSDRAEVPVNEMGAQSKTRNPDKVDVIFPANRIICSLILLYVKYIFKSKSLEHLT